MAGAENKKLQENISLIKQASTAYSQFSNQIPENIAQLKAMLDVTMELNKQLKSATGIKAFSEQQKKVKASIQNTSTATRESIRIQIEAEKLEQQRIRTSAAQAREKSRLERETNKLNSAYKRESARLTELRNRAKEVAIQFGVNSREFRNAAREVNALDGRLRNIDSSLGQNQRNVGNYSSALKGLGKQLLGAFGVIGGLQLFAKALKDGFQQIRKFEKDSAILAGVLGKTRGEITKLTKDAKRLGGVTAKTSSEILALQTAYARLGFTQSEIIDLTEDTINGSIALNAELADTADLTGVVVKSFDDLHTTDAGLILDQLTLSTQKTALSFDKLKTAIPIASGAAAAAKVPFTTFISQLGQAADRGIDASSAATSLRNIYITLSDKGISLSEALTKINKSQDKLSEANKIFGARAATTALALSKTIDKTRKLDTALQDAGGTAKRVADEQLKTLDGRITLMSSAWQGFIDSLNEGEGSITTFFSNLTSSITSNITKLTRLNTTFEDLVARGVDKRMSDISAAMRQMGDEISDSEGVREQLLKNLIAYEKAAKDAGRELADLGGETGVFDEIATAFNINVEQKNYRDFLVQIEAEYKNTAKAITELLSVESDESLLDAFTESIIGQDNSLKGLKEETNELIEVETDLIKIQQELLNQAKELPGSTEAEIEARNNKIAVISAEIKRLRELGELQKIDFPTVDTEAEISELEKLGEEVDRIQDEEISDYLDKEKAKTDILKQEAQQRKDLNEGLTEAGFESADILADQFLQNSQQRRDEETQAEIDALNERLENDSLDAEQRELVQAQIAQKEKKIKTDKAKADKKAAMVQAAINTALSIGKTAATLGFPAAIPFIVAATATGLAQQIAIASQPIPKFDKGKKNAPRGGFWAGEKRPEFMIHKGKTTLIDRPTLFGDEYKGAEIISGSRSAQIIEQINRQQIVEGVTDSKRIDKEQFNLAFKEAMIPHTRAMVSEMRKNRPIKQSTRDYRADNSRQIYGQ